MSATVSPVASAAMRDALLAAMADPSWRESYERWRASRRSESPSAQPLPHRSGRSRSRGRG